MSEQPNEGLTSAEIKKQIEEAKKTQKIEEGKKSLKDSGLPLTGQVANEINATLSTPEETTKTESKPDPEKPAAEKDVDLQAWAKKRGIDWTTEESVLSALRKSDQEFHKRQAERKAREMEANPPYRPPSYQPPTQPYPFQVYPFQSAPPSSKEVVENIAKQYNMLPEDVERLAAFNRDFFEVASRVEREKLQHEMESIRLENQKNSVFRELSSDPAFRHPEVGREFTQVLDVMQNSDPKAFENPSAYRRAFEIALSNIARRNLEGRTLEEGTPPTPRMTPPLIPPRSLGTLSGGGAGEKEEGIDPKEFARLPLEEKRKVLEKAGLRSAY